MSLHASMIELLEEENLKQEQWQIQDGSKVGNGHNIMNIDDTKKRR